eukprot:TRINITY_DN44251_c0_g1_i3.p1 TRINITY_DN44251_c0_g1~~TRINITY_DN44251_c0_g1_i3.p1  ORF type:complete len:204 (-),score=45.41 TRINITY_DN44251_c0_g1_i3:156-767(-)
MSKTRLMACQVRWVAKRFDELSTSELYQILQFRLEVFVVEQNVPFNDCDDMDQDSVHLMAYYTPDPCDRQPPQREELVSYMRLIKPGVAFESESSFGRVMVRQRYRGGDLGRTMVKKGLWLLQNHPALTSGERGMQTVVKINAECGLEKWYARHGFAEVDEQWDDLGVMMQPMRRDVSEMDFEGDELLGAGPRPQALLRCVLH